jgi:predicted metal-dependent hydrolase
MYPTAYLDYIIYFHVERDYFECHEVLEEHWKEEPPSQRQPHWVGLIQIAVGLYHHRRKNVNGALRMYNKALQAVNDHAIPITKLGIDVDKVKEILKKQIQSLSEVEQSFSDVTLPITDPQLIEDCKKRCEQLGLKWFIQDSTLIQERIIHKHKERDRQDVVDERVKQLQLRAQKRQ